MLLLGKLVLPLVLRPVVLLAGARTVRNIKAAVEYSFEITDVAPTLALDGINAQRVLVDDRANPM